jgi:lipopolysaccharide transport system permease protein
MESPGGGVAHQTSDATDAMTIIRPSGPWVGLDVLELWKYRDLLLILAARDLRLRYRQTALGILWVVLQPLLGATLLAFVFGRVAGLDAEGVPYLPFVLAGLLGWGLFSAIVTRSTTALVNYPHLVSKVYFPRQLLPLSTVLPALTDYLVGFGVLLALLPAYGMPIESSAFRSLLWILPVTGIAVALGLITSSLAVTYRDIAHVMPVLLQFVMYASPVAYSVSAVPPTYRPLFLLNPLAPLLEGLRSSVLGTQPPQGSSTAMACGVSIGLLLAALLFFGRRQRELADVI